MTNPYLEIHTKSSHRTTWDMTSVLDEKRRVVLPKDLAEDLGLIEGSKVVFRKEKDVVVLKKLEESDDSLREMMSWNPKRTGKLKPVKEIEVKGIWKHE